MDTSKEYIKMCEKALEIQRVKPPSFTHTEFGFEDVSVDEKGSFSLLTTKNKKVDYIWLPRQDQLQEIMSDKYTVQEMLIVFDAFTLPFLNAKLSKKERGKQTKYVSQFMHSMEQLWLTFVMKEKHRRIWNENEWILQKNI